MKVLLLCHRAPYPPVAGSKVRAFNVLRHFGRQGHAVTVATLAHSAAELAEAQALRDHCAEILIDRVDAPIAWMRAFASLPTACPSSFAYFHSSSLRRRLRRSLRADSFDLIFVHSSSMAPYVEGVSGPVKILDFCDMDSQKWREYSRQRRLPLSLGYWLEAVKLERTEARLAPRFDLCTCATRAELESLRALGIESPADWFPNGVDGEAFQPADGYDANRIAFVGRMDYYPNQQAVTEFCRHVLPLLQQRRPTLRFDIVGANPPPSIRLLAHLTGVTVTGTVADVRPYVQRAALTVAPLRIARGTQNKVLESMAMGVPVVCSPEVEKGVDALAGEHLLCASGHDELVREIERVLDSAALRRQLAHAGRERVLTHHAWSASMARLDSLVREAFDRRAESGGAIHYALH